MKILYITNGNLPDYLADTILFGLREMFGADIVDAPKRPHIYTSYDPALTAGLWGRGFTTTRILPDIEVDRTDILSKIKNKYFDYVFFAAIWDSTEFMQEAFEAYPINKIIIIDGYDAVKSLHSIVNSGAPYFKREIFYHAPEREGILYTKQKNVFPISFSIPTTKVNFQKTNKTRDFAYCDPRDRSTFIYNNEADYYKGYGESRFAITFKKAGWDCMRHYEILANGCLPYFLDIHNCPDETMTSYPKHLCLSLNKEILYGNNFSSLYDKYIESFYTHFVNNNTSDKETLKLIDTIKTL